MPNSYVGGLSVSFFMTLFVVLVMYSLLNSRGDKSLCKTLFAGAFVASPSVIRPFPNKGTQRTPVP